MKNTLSLLFVGLLIVTNVVVGALYLLERGSGASAQPTAQITTQSTDKGTEKSASVESFNTSSNKPPNYVNYKAKFGNYSLEISDEYRIGVGADGGNAGLQTNKVQIGRFINNQEGVFLLGNDDSVTIEAYPTKINGTRDQFIMADTALQANIADEVSAKIDGLPVRKFVINGVGETTKYYFERNGVTYLIEAWDVSSGDTQVMLNDTVKGFSFN